MGKGLDVQLAEIYAAFLERRKKRNEALLDIFDAIAAAKAPGDLDGVVRETIAKAIHLGMVQYPPVWYERVRKPYFNTWLGCESAIIYPVKRPVPEEERTVELPGGYRITESQLRYYERLFAGRIEVWRARLSADELPRWEKTAALLNERRLELGWSTTRLAVEAGVSPRTIQRVLAGKPISRASLEATKKALKLR